MNKLTNPDIKKIKKEFTNDYTNILKYYKSKFIVKFIYDRINYNDNIVNIKKKLFVYLSDVNNNIYFNTNNQLLVVDEENINNKILGYYYNNYKIDVNNINKKIEIDENFYDSEIDMKIDRSDIIDNNDLTYGYLYNKLKLIKNIKQIIFSK